MSRFRSESSTISTLSFLVSSAVRRLSSVTTVFLRFFARYMFLSARETALVSGSLTARTPPMLTESLSPEYPGISALWIRRLMYLSCWVNLSSVIPGMMSRNSSPP